MCVWKVENNKLIKEFNFNSFEKAVAFVNSVANIAKKYNHHPEIYNYYTKVVISLYSVEQKQITTQDHQIAQEIDLL